MSEIRLIDVPTLQAEIDQARAEAGGKASPLDMAVTVVLHLCARIAPILTEFNTRLAALENRKMLFFEGPHDPAKTYGAGAVVQRAGGTWVALVETAEAPGQSSHWRQIGVSR